MSTTPKGRTNRRWVSSEKHRAEWDRIFDRVHCYWCAKQIRRSEAKQALVTNTAGLSTDVLICTDCEDRLGCGE